MVAFAGAGITLYRFVEQFPWLMPVGIYVYLCWAVARKASEYADRWIRTHLFVFVVSLLLTPIIGWFLFLRED